MDTENALQRAKRRLGVGEIARICDVSREAVRKWCAQGHLPRTEWTGESNYAERIAQGYALHMAFKPELGEVAITAADLLALKPVASRAQRSLVAAAA
ncbi:MAG: hypothetical protein AB7P37_03340 [Ramlibacter sp.]